MITFWIKLRVHVASSSRYYAVMRPLQILDIHRRGKILLMFAWIGSILCSIPQVH